MPKFIALLLLVVAALSIGSLVSGVSYSTWVFPGGLPLGNVLAAGCLCSLAGAAVLLSPRRSIRHRVSLMALLAAAVWLPFSIVLAGNLALNFQGFSGTVWLAATAATVIVVLASLASAVVGFLLGLRTRSTAA